MKNIFTITFHASHNYGSNLQAYALQEFIKENFNCNYKIINLRTTNQKNIYKNVYNKREKNLKKVLKNIILKIVFFKYKKDLFLKEEKFEQFINNELNITKEYNSSEELKNIKFPNGSYFISGSDQLWNLKPDDFDWAYYLEFVNSPNKIAYAASFGPIDYQINENDRLRIKENLEKYKIISVREEGSKNFINKMYKKDIEVNLDPTMLLSKNKWIELFDKTPILNYEYILLYDLKCNNETYQIAKKVEEILKIPVVITTMNSYKEVCLPFKKCVACGPKEFLNLEYNAKLVLSSSFHGNVFAIIFNKPFFAVNGDKDNRISNLLKTIGLENRTININNVFERIKIAFDLKFEQANKYLEIEKEKSINYLFKALDVNKKDGDSSE